MDRRKFLKAASGLFVPALPALILPGRTLAQSPVLPGPGLPTAAASLGLQTSLGAFYSLDNTLVDATGNMSALTNNNSVTFSSPGGTLSAVTNAAIFASASSKYLSVAAATAINMTGSFSVSFWYYNTGGGGAFPISKYVGFGNGDLDCASSFTGGASPVSLGSGRSTSTLVSSGNQTQNTWHNYVFTYNSTGNAQNIYVDGSPVANNTSGTVPSGTGNLNIGASATPGNYIDGRMALVGLWKGRVLSSGDASLLWNSGGGLSYAAMA